MPHRAKATRRDSLYLQLTVVMIVQRSLSEA